MGAWFIELYARAIHHRFGARREVIRTARDDEPRATQGKRAEARTMLAEIYGWFT